MINFYFKDLMERHDEPECAVLIQAIAVISVQPDFQHMTPDEVFDFVKSQAEAVADDAR